MELTRDLFVARVNELRARAEKLTEELQQVIGAAAELEGVIAYMDQQQVPPPEETAPVPPIRVEYGDIANTDGSGGS